MTEITAEIIKKRIKDLEGFHKKNLKVAARINELITEVQSEIAPPKKPGSKPGVWQV